MMSNTENKKALIAMSGGVDSSVAAALMIQDGYECIGCTMKLLGCLDEMGVADGDPSASESGRTCCSLEDTEDARSVARKLGMAYYVFNFSEDFGEKVIDRFVRIYQAGGTPNPCIDCNRYMKFGKLFLRARELGCDVVVTGHYARTKYDEKSGRWQLLRTKRPDMERGTESSRFSDKDQTYVLYSMTQEQLAHARFPLGEYSSKEEVRKLADHWGFVNSRKPDSQDICFVPDGKYADFIERKTGQKAAGGDFVDEEGNVLGKHRGLIRYTVGQRRGLGLALPAPLYVQRIDTQKNQVVLTPEERLFSRRLIAEDFNWIWTPDWGMWDGRDGRGADTPPVGYTCEATAKPRYRAREAEATARVLEGGKVEILFREPQRALTIGQAVVLFSGEYVVGGGTICEVP